MNEFIKYFTFGHFDWLNVINDRRGPENGGLSVYLCVFLSVCPSVNSRLPKLLNRFQQKLPHWVPEWSSCARMWIGSLVIRIFNYVTSAMFACRHICTLTGKNFIRFSWNWKCEYNVYSVVARFHISFQHFNMVCYFDRYFTINQR